jgi:hypothetical protein
LKSFVVWWMVENNTHTPYHNPYEKSSSLADVKSKDINDVKKQKFTRFV